MNLQDVLKLIPGGSQTWSKSPGRFPDGFPQFIDKAEGAYCWDAEGNRYIDFSSSLCSVILGYQDPDVEMEVTEQMMSGNIFSLPSSLEYEVAKLLNEIIPCAEMVRFFKNGNDATSAAIRLARAWTGRDLIASFGYHGCQDWSVGGTEKGLGVPSSVASLTKRFIYNDLDSLESIFRQFPGQVACVIMEPVSLEEPYNTPYLQTPNYLRQVERMAHDAGALLIFDEIVTGFRVSLGGAQSYYKTIPDLACFGKAMSNGYPLSAVVGEEKYMRLLEKIFYSTTFGGDALSLAAAKATIKKMKDNPVIEHIWKQGTKLKNHWNDLKGLAPHLVFDKKEHLDFVRLEMIKRGILFTDGFNVTYAHSDNDIGHAMEAISEICQLTAVPA